jgi:hypothetical protein
MKYVALGMAGFFLIIYFYGGPMYASCTCSQAGKSTLLYYFLGFGVLALYLPMYLYRKKIEDPKVAANVEPPPPPLETPGIATEVGT